MSERWEGMHRRFMAISFFNAYQEADEERGARIMGWMQKLTMEKLAMIQKWDESVAAKLEPNAPRVTVFESGVGW